LLYGIVVVLLKYGENEAKKAKNCIFKGLKSLQYKAFRKLFSHRFYTFSPYVIPAKAGIHLSPSFLKTNNEKLKTFLKRRIF